ncbi:MAG: cytochrome c [Pseudomonadota bacterium]
MSATEIDKFVTAAQRHHAGGRLWRLFILAIVVIIFLIGLAAIIVGSVALARFTDSGTPHHEDIVEHFKYGSIGSEPESGLPYWLWQALPRLYPEEFEGRNDYRAFGFLYEKDDQGEPRDLPIGVSQRRVNGVDLVWLNCAICHAGTVRMSADDTATIIPAMPSNNLDLMRFIEVVLGAGPDPELAPDNLFPVLDKMGADLDWIDRLVWRLYVLPQVREGLLDQRAKLGELLEAQSDWGPGRVDTFNPYKLLEFGQTIADLGDDEIHGASDFPSIFHQGPRDGMQLHWDGNNPSLQERNLSAAIGAGVTEATVDHAAIERVADWLTDLAPAPSPHMPEAALVSTGRDIYMDHCAACHGYRADDGAYVFAGEHLGTVTPIAEIATDAGRLNSYTEELSNLQRGLFANEPEYAFRHFRKTDGYANQPLDGLWLRAPYLHNGAVPTLADLLTPETARPQSYVRGLDQIDWDKGGFIAPHCTPGEVLEEGFCFDTTASGNGNQGHGYGTDLPAGQKSALLAYLKTF